MKNKILTAIFGVTLFFLILTVCIGMPIYCRFFYYVQINTLGLVEKTGYSYQTIKTAYDQVLNYLTLPGFEFGTGELKYSADGMAHFVDCKVLFNLNFWVMLISAVICITLFILHKKGVFTLVKPKGFFVGFWSAIVAIVLPIIIGGLAALDFNRAFQIFHMIFFPGKDNWVFNPSEDEIIRILPQTFFMNCAIFIGVSLIVICTVIIVLSIVARKKENAKNK